MSDKSRVILVFGVVLGVLSLQASPTALCPLVDTPPVIDGVLDDDAWRMAPVNAGFRDCGEPGPAKPSMEFRLATDGKWLYVAVKAMHPSPASLKGLPATHDSTDMFSNDCVELLLAPVASEATYYHFAFGPSGSYWDSLGQQGQIDYNYDTEFKTRLWENGWSLEIAVPLHQLNLPRGVQIGHAMALNVCREFKGKPFPKALHAWSPPGGSFHNRSAFGEVLVGSYPQNASRRVEELRTSLAQASKAQGADKRLEFLTTRLAGLRADNPEDADAWVRFRNEAERLESDIGRLRLAGRDMVLYAVNPWQLPQAESLPGPDTEEIDEIVVTAFQGQVITRAFAVANAGNKSVRLQCLATDLISPDGSQVLPAATHLKLCNATEVALRGGSRVRDALPPLTPASHLHIDSSANGVVWLSINTHDAKPGTWVSGITLFPLLQPERRRVLRLVVHIQPAEPPTSCRPFVYNWYHLKNDLCTRYPDAVVADLKAHYINVIKVKIGWPEYGADGQETTPLDLSDFEENMERFGIEGNHFLVDNFYHWFPKTHGNSDVWSETQQVRFGKLVRQIRAFFESHGLGVEDFSWYAHDEPTTVEHGQRVANFGKRLRQVDPEQRIFVTIYSKVTKEAMALMTPYVSLWVPTLNAKAWQRDIVQARQREGFARTFSYAVLSKSSNPYWQYRLMGWKALEYGYEGLGFWNYDDLGGPGMTNWDDTDGQKSDYAVIYEGDRAPVSSVRWEAARQAVEDYRLVKWVQLLAARSKDARLAKLAEERVQKTMHDFPKNTDLTAIDRSMEQIGGDVTRLLIAEGAIPQQTSDGSFPFNLTGNGGYTSRHLDTHGTYTYSRFMESYGEASGVTNGNIYFSGDEAKAGPQEKNKMDGDLTNDRVRYPKDYVIWFSPPREVSVIFDFKKQYRYSHAHLLLHTLVPKQVISVSVSKDGTEGSWRKVSAAKAGKLPLAVSGELLLELNACTGRFLRFDFETAKEAVRLGEVRVWGWPE